MGMLSDNSLQKSIDTLTDLNLVRGIDSNRNLV